MITWITRELALACIEAGQGLAAHLQARRPGPAVDLAAALAEVERREQKYNSGKPFPDLEAGSIPRGRPMGE